MEFTLVYESFNVIFSDCPPAAPVSRTTAQAERTRGLVHAVLRHEGHDPDRTVQAPRFLHQLRRPAAVLSDVPGGDREHRAGAGSRQQSRFGGRFRGDLIEPCVCLCGKGCECVRVFARNFKSVLKRARN